jgi:hypothetical protein
MIDLHHVLAYGMNGELYTEDAIRAQALVKGQSFHRFCKLNEVFPYTVEDAMNADGDVSAWDVDGSPYVIWESEEADDDAI